MIPTGGSIRVEINHSSVKLLRLVGKYASPYAAGIPNANATVVESRVIKIVLLSADKNGDSNKAIRQFESVGSNMSCGGEGEGVCFRLE